MEQVPCAYGLNGGSPDARAPLSQEYACLVDRLDPEHSLGIFATPLVGSRVSLCYLPTWDGKDFRLV